MIVRSEIRSTLEEPKETLPKTLKFPYVKGFLSVLPSVMILMNTCDFSEKALASEGSMN